MITSSTTIDPGSLSCLCICIRAVVPCAVNDNSKSCQLPSAGKETILDEGLESVGVVTRIPAETEPPIAFSLALILYSFPLVIPDKS